MANKLMGAGDETKYALLGGFETVADGGQGRRGASGFGISPLLERVAASTSAALAARRFSDDLRDVTGGGIGEIA